MNVLVVADGHYYKDRNGEYYVDSVFDYNFYKRYLTAFEEVFVIARCVEVDKAPSSSKKASGEHVHFLTIPDSVGAMQFFRNYPQIRKTIKKLIHKYDCAIFRVPGVTANAVFKLWDKRKPYALEVVVDPWEYFAPGTIKGISRPFVRLWWTYELKRMCANAPAVSYVTRKYLQKRYPCKALKGLNGYITANYSSVELPDDKFQSPKTYVKKDKYTISHVAASFATYGKGHITLMNAIKVVKDRGYRVSVKFIGDGPLRCEFENYSRKLGIDKEVIFSGLLPSGEAVREAIRQSDLFVFPTRAEGLPRVVLEAMAEGLPVLSSPVCGIPEILSKECLIDYDDYYHYADAIIKLIESPNRMSQLSRNNVKTAYKYRRSKLMEHRRNFYMSLRNLTLHVGDCK